MKKFYCPYCGEKSLTALQKTSFRSQALPIRRTIVNKGWLSCNNCGKEVGTLASGKGFLIQIILLLCSLVLLVLLVLFISIKKFQLALYTAPVIFVLLIIMMMVKYKYDVFIRKAVGNNDIIAKASIKLNTEFLEQQIYIIRAKYKNKRNVESMYIAALSNYSPKDATCDVRFIKPAEAAGLIEAGKFEVYDDDKLVGAGEFIS
ncbi:MAG: hypothetical protein IJL83_06180 [Clostridia bacterium]|nr:hypothetical protein [Clostridia bacterium]